MKLCPQCGAQNRDTARFCQNCSTVLVASLDCPSCGTSNAPSARYCQNCSTPLRGNTPMAGLTGRLALDYVLQNRYQIDRVLGRGGFGAVYLVGDNRLPGKRWAIKEMSDASLPDPAEKLRAVENFQREATLLASLNHPNLTKVTDFFAEGGRYYLW